MRSDVGDAFGVGFRENEKRAQPVQKKRIRRKEKHTGRYRPAELDSQTRGESPCIHREFHSCVLKSSEFACKSGERAFVSARTSFSEKFRIRKASAEKIQENGAMTPETGRLLEVRWVRQRRGEVNAAARAANAAARLPDSKTLAP